MASLSLCMIVKNEEKVLARCLDSVEGLADEIIIVDTGSTDKTKEIASKYTEKIFDFIWEKDFSKARNFSFSKATGDFVMWLDADDVILEKDRNLLIDVKNSVPEGVNTVMVKYNTAFDEDGNPTFSYYRERIVRNVAANPWHGWVHEVMVCPGERMYIDAAVTHKSIKTSYSDRNLKIYEAHYEAGKSFSPRDMFYYGRELYYNGRFKEAIAILSRFLDEGKGWIENNIEACKILSYSYEAVENNTAAFSALTRSFLYDLPRAEILCDIGRTLMKKEKYREATFWYELALKQKKDEKSGGFINSDCYGYIPSIQLCICWDRLGDIEKAKYYNDLAGKYRPKSTAYLNNVEYFKRLAGGNMTQPSFT